MRISFGSSTAVNYQPVKVSFTSIEAKPQNKEQVQTLANIAYKTKETGEKRLGSPLLMKANITKDTATFSTAKAGKANQNMVDSIMQFYLRQTNIPFKQV